MHPRFFTLPALSLFTLATALKAETNAILNVEAVPEKGQTLVWSPLFQAGWDRLNAQFDKKLGQASPPNALIDQLDNMQWDEAATLPKGDYLSLAGASNQVCLLYTSPSPRDA